MRFHAAIDATPLITFLLREAFDTLYFAAAEAFRLVYC